MPLLTLDQNVEKLKMLKASTKKQNVQCTFTGGIYVCIQHFQHYKNTTLNRSVRRAKGVEKVFQLRSKVEKI